MVAVYFFRLLVRMHRSTGTFLHGILLGLGGVSALALVSE